MVVFMDIWDCQAAIGAARTATFFPRRAQPPDRLPPRQGKGPVAVARPILVIVCHLLADPTARFTNLGPGYYQARTDTDRKIRNHIRQIALTRPGPPPHTIYPE
jgi:hypothetical protein